jgi:hypothetical protein
MALARDVAMDLEPPKTPETPTPTPILLSSSPDPISEEESDTIHVQVGPRPFALSQSILPQKRGGGNNVTTPERLRLSRPAPALKFQFQKQKGTTTLPVAHTAQEALYIARDMVLQASTLAETNQEQTRLLDLLEVFRNYTESGRVVREELVSNSKRKTYADAAKPAKTYAEATRPDTATHLNNTSLLRRSAHAAPPAKATAAQVKKDTQKRELVLLVEEANTAEAEVVDPLAQRNAINAALKTVSNSAAVVASVRLTARKNLLLTTTERFSADFLLQHKDAWKSAIHVTCKGMQTQEEQIQVVAHKVYMHEAFTSSTAELKAEIESFNNVVIQGNPRWLAKREKLENAHLLPPHQRYASIAFVVGSEEERQRLLAYKQLSIAGRTVYLTKYYDISPRTQCQSCFKLGHNREMCRDRGCKLCAEPHYTKDHRSCSECKLTGRLCEHQKPRCINCRGEHTATSRKCTHLSNTRTSTSSASPLC